MRAKPGHPRHIADVSRSPTPMKSGPCGPMPRPQTAKAREAGAVADHHVVVLDRHGLGLGGAVDVDELRQHVAGLVLFEPFLGLSGVIVLLPADHSADVATDLEQRVPEVMRITGLAPHCDERRAALRSVAARPRRRRPTIEVSSTGPAAGPPIQAVARNRRCRSAAAVHSVPGPLDADDHVLACHGIDVGGRAGSVNCRSVASTPFGRRRPTASMQKLRGCEPRHQHTRPVEHGAIGIRWHAITRRP